MKNAFRFFFCAMVAILFAATAYSQVSNQLPCFVSQTDRQVFNPGDDVVVYGVPSGNGNCRNERISARGFEIGLAFQLNSWNASKGDWDFVRYDETSYSLDGGHTRTNTVTYKGLKSGHYTLAVVDGTSFLESLWFDVAGADDNKGPAPFCFGSSCPKQFDATRRPYVKPSSIVKGGYLYIQGYIGRDTKGYLYQVRPDATEIRAVDILQVDPNDASQFVNRGAGLGFGWLRIKLPANTFSTAYPVYASITADGGGVTANGMVFDPSDPAREMDNGLQAALNQ